MADVRVGGAYVDFFGRTIRFQNATRRNIAAMRRQRQALQDLRRTVRDYNRTADQLVRRVGLLGAVGFALAAREVARFTQTLATVQGISQATEQQFLQLTNQAIDLGRRTRFTATQAAEGQLFLARAGFSVQEVFQVLPGTLNLAQAAVVDVGRAADIVTNVMLAFGAGADQTSRFVDVLVKVTNSANTNLEQLADGLRFAGSLSNVLGLDIEEAAAAIGVLSDAGIQAGQAGTGLRQIFADLTRLTGPATEALADLGLTAEDVSIQQNGLVNVLQTLTQAGASAEDIFSIFEVRAATAFVTLQGNIDRLVALEERARNAAGAAQELADIQDNTLTGAYLRARSALEGFVLRLNQLSGAGESARQFLDTFSESVNQFTDRLSQNLPRIIAGLQLLFGFWLSRRVLFPAITAIRGLVLQIGFLRSGLFLAARAARALTRGLLFLGVFEGLLFLYDFFTRLTESINQSGESVLTLVRYLTLSLTEALARFIIELPEYLSELVQIIAVGLFAPFEALGQGLFNAVRVGFTGGDSSEILNALLGGFTTAFDNLRARVASIVSDDNQTFFGDLADTIDFTELFGFTAEQRAGLDDKVRTALEQAIANFRQRWTEILEGGPELQLPVEPVVPEVPLPPVIGVENFQRLVPVVDRLNDLGRDLNRTFESFFEGLITNTQSVGDALAQLGRELARVAARYLLIRPLLAGIFSPERTPSLFELVRGFQSGGIASGLSLVGERGPELVDFRSPGRVYSAADTRGLLGGGASISYALSVSGGGTAEDNIRAVREKLYPELTNLTLQTLAEHERRRRA